MFKKTFIKSMAYAIILASISLLVVSCQQEPLIPTPTVDKTTALENSIKPKGEVSEPQALAIPCGPTTSVTGYNALVAALNNKTCLSVPFCVYGTVTHSTVQMWNISQYLRLPNTVDYFWLSPNTVVTATTQQQLINSAKNLAAANVPAGCFVSNITFHTAWVGQFKAAIYIAVTYSKCGPPPPQD
jgi:hypothetical protein